jgi:hypothetical protein
MVADIAYSALGNHLIAGCFSLAAAELQISFLRLRRRLEGDSGKELAKVAQPAFGNLTGDEICSDSSEESSTTSEAM